MNKKILVFIILGLLACGSCTSQAQNPLPSILSTPGRQLSTSTPAPSNTLTLAPAITPSPALSNTPLPSITPAQLTDLPGNSLIAFSEDVSSIYELSPTTETLVPIFGYPNGMDRFISPSWSPSGNQLVFTRIDSYGYEIYIINRDGSGIRLLRDKAGADPTWSPDGEHIAYTTNSGLYILNLDGGNLERLVNSVDASLPAWSPDGKWLAFLSPLSAVASNYSYKIYLVDNDGKNLHIVTDAVAGESKLSWSPDGSKIAFRSSEGCGDIDILDLKSGLITDLTGTPGVIQEDPAWSPDGNYIVYERNTNTPCDQKFMNTYYGGPLFIINLNGLYVKWFDNTDGFQPSWWPTVILRSGWSYSVTQAGANLNLRVSAAKSAKSLTKLAKGAIFTVLDGPLQADGYTWWHVRSDAGIEGWMVDVPGWYMFNKAGTVQP